MNPPCNLKLPYHIDGFTPSIPLGLAYIAAVLRQEGHKVLIIDAPAEGRSMQAWNESVCTIGLPWRIIRDRINGYNPDVVGVSCAFSSRFMNALKVTQYAKQVIPDVVTVMGGIHPTILPDETLKHPSVDFVILGEGEETIVKLLDGKSNPEKIDGLAWQQNGDIHLNPKTQFIEDLDKLPFPARDLLPMEQYRCTYREPRWETGKESVSNPDRNTIITSRGCPFDCTFCSIHASWGYKWRARSPEDVVEELREMIDVYGLKQMSFEDDNLLYSRKRMIELCGLIIEEKLDFEWDTPNGVNMISLDRELLALMKKAGCRTLKFGIESLDPNILKDVIHKPLTIEIARNIVNLCKELGINTIGNFVLGMPGETRDTIQRTIDAAKTLPLDELNVAIATPYPGTQLYDLCLEKGYIEKFDYANFLADDSMETSAMINTPWLKAAEVMELRKTFYEEFRHTRLQCP